MILSAFALLRWNRPALSIGQPQPKQMALAGRFVRPVFECTPRVQRDVVVEELSIAGLEVHRYEESGIVEELLDEFERVKFVVGERTSLLLAGSTA